MSSDSQIVIAAAVAATALAGLVTAIFTYKAKTKNIRRKEEPKNPEHEKKQEKNEEEEKDKQGGGGGEEDVYEMALIVRNDLKMGKGKIGAQCGHASLGTYKTAKKKDPAAVEAWERQGRKKVAFVINSEEQL